MKKVNIDRLIEHLRSRDPLPALFRLDESGTTVRVPQTTEERQRMLECWDDHKEMPRRGSLWIGPVPVQPADPETKRAQERREAIDIAHRGADYWSGKGR